MHIYSVLNKLFTPKVEQEKVQNNTNEQTQKTQAESKEKILPTKSVSKIPPSNPTNKAQPSKAGVGKETCFVAFPKTGDTLAVSYNKQQITLKLAGVDGSEKGVRWNKQAIRFLKQEIQIEKTLAFIDIVGKDSDGVMLVELYLDKEKTRHLNKILLEQDFAMDIKPIVKENNTVAQKPEAEEIVQQANSELLEVKPKVVDNSLWEGLPEDIDSMPMPDDYFWQSQISDENNFPIEQTSSNNNAQADNNLIEFNPFADPPIEPLSVYPNGIKPVLEFKEPIVEATSSLEIPEYIDMHIDFPIEVNNDVKSEILDLLDKENIKVEFNPFADPPIEPLSVYPNGVKPVISEVIDIAPIENNEHLQVNVPVTEVKNLLEQIDTVIEEVIAPISKPVEINTVNNVEISKESIEAVENNNQEEVPQETKPAKVVLKFGSKAKANLPKVEDDIEAALEKKEKENLPIMDKKIVEALPEPEPAPKIETEFRAKHKPASPLSPEYDPFSDTVLESDNNNNIDVTSLLSEFDSLGDIVSAPEEKVASKKKKFGN
jgi:hypothetical protein